MAATDQEYEAVVEQVRRWPSERQFALLHEVLRVLAGEQKHADQFVGSKMWKRMSNLGAGDRPPHSETSGRSERDHPAGSGWMGRDRSKSGRPSTLAHAIGLLKADGPPPTDEEVRRLLEERRIEKYG